ncbi:MAG TPA: methylmalonyl Co-A mutase-associated GTPase MeaB [Calditrichia bacterium]|nr:methylmalonyl Co-A mutase-associated GTPase MeaB [Calditrichota bacterium]HQV32247.1 methylmalonyl Co-A mutase-associated GTPase MeaB [Calditrichia bacterium]
MSDKRRKPEWTPENAGSEFAGSVVPGKKAGGNPAPRPRARGSSSPAELVNAVRQGERTALGKAITLVESRAEKHRRDARELLQLLLPFAGKSIRIGITGVPGAGKSTLIERLGLHLAAAGFKIAVLAVDPSSSISSGSILGDKTRMAELARHPNAFIRPSPSGGTLGGVARKTRETIQVCEAAGYDVIIVETIGVGQSEIAVRAMVDFFLLVQITGGGDDLQGIKKGVMELVDAIVVNKADGPNRAQILATRQELESALHFFPPATPGWKPPVTACSAISGEGIPELWQTVRDFTDFTRQKNLFQNRRQEQSLAWMHELIRAEVLDRFYRDPGIAGEIAHLESRIRKGEIQPGAASAMVLAKYWGGEETVD